MRIEVTEGSRFGNVYALTEDELRRLLFRQTVEVRQAAKTAKETAAKRASRADSARRVAQRETRELRAEVEFLRSEVARLRAARNWKPETPDQISRRRATYRLSATNRYQRYKALLEHFGEESTGARWSRHLCELDRRLREGAVA